MGFDNNNNITQLKMNKIWNDTIFDLENSKIVKNNEYSRYTYTQNIYNDPKVPLLEKYKLFNATSSKIPSYYYDNLLLSPNDQKYLINEYGEPLEAPRDLALLNTLNKLPINVEGYLVDNAKIKKYANAVSTRQKISNAFDFETLQRVEPKDFDSRLLKAIAIKNIK